MELTDMLRELAWKLNIIRNEYRLSYAQPRNRGREFRLTWVKIIFALPRKANFQYFQSPRANTGRRGEVYKRRRPRKWQLSVNDFTRRNWRCRPLQFNPPSGPPTQLGVLFFFRSATREKSSARRETGGNKVDCSRQIQGRYLFPREKDVGFFKIHINSCTFHVYICSILRCCGKGKICKERIALKKASNKIKRASPMTRHQFPFHREQIGE